MTKKSNDALENVKTTAYYACMAKGNNTAQNVQNALVTGVDIGTSLSGGGLSLARDFLGVKKPDTKHRNCCNEWDTVDQPKICSTELFSNSDSGSTMHIFNILIIVFSLYLYKKCNSKFNAGELCWACCCPLCYIMYKMAFDNCL
tara:strand:+ start:390 stop:824 length:435 start_codon:yes stop_codon:yes gene_type:complete